MEKSVNARLRELSSDVQKIELRLSQAEQALRSLRKAAKAADAVASKTILFACAVGRNDEDVG